MLKKILLLSLLFITHFSSVFAEEFDRKEITKLENYLNSITSIEAKFLQTNPDGSLSEGKFYLQKPGKFRWEYQDQPIIIIANGKSLIYYDKELEQANYVPIENSIASLITRSNLKFGGDLKIINFSSNKGSSRISLQKENQKDVGEFSFIFKKNDSETNPFELGKIELIDASSKQKISIDFMEMKINNGTIPISLFKIRDPRLK